MDRDELRVWLRLSLTPGVGNQTARQLLAAFGLPDTVFGQSRAALRQVVSARQADSLLSVPPSLEQQLATTLQWLAGAGDDGRGLATLADASYPASLLTIEDPPLMLYWQGRTPDRGMPLDARMPRAVAMVGSRNPTPQGALNAREFARSFSAAGLTVISGLALGVDGESHSGALDGQAPGSEALATVAVVGTGLDRVYPRQHRALAHRIAAQGLLLSEYPLGTPPLAPNFPQRNRIISGLSRGTLVVEAALASGSLITARMASEQGRDVWAIPGSIHSPQSRGCHALIKQGAKLVESAQDVLEELAPASGGAVAARATPPGEIHSPCDTPDNAGGLLAAMGFDPVSLDALVARTGETASALQVSLLEMELDGRVARLPGGLFQQQGRG